MTETEVQECLRRWWPDWPVWSLELFSDQGWDHELFLANHRWVVRIARTASACRHLPLEMAWLARLGDALPLATPHYVRAVYGVGVYERLVGAPADARRLPAQPSGRILGQFLARLHAARPLDPARQARARRRWRSRFVRLGDQVDREAGPLLSAVQRRRLSARFRDGVQALDDPAVPMTLIHGDLRLEHILVADGRPVAVIDFGDMTVGDPMLDFAGLDRWMPAALGAYQGEGAPARAAFYRWAASGYQVLHALRLEQPRGVEQGLSALLAQTP